MPTMNEVLALLHHVGTGNKRAVYATALSIATAGDGKKQSKPAQQLEKEARRALESLDRLAGVSLQKLDHIAVPGPEGCRLDDMVLDPETRDALEHFMSVHNHAELLAEKGLALPRRVLLSGPPGTGKTTAAAMLASELARPFFVVRADQVIDSHYGSTARNLRKVFDGIASCSEPTVWLFDEFDALGLSRLSGDDVGEARRVTTALLQMIAEDRSDAILIAATNLRDSLDAAVFRRFDIGVDTRLPTEAEAYDLICRAFEAAGCPLPPIGTEDEDAQAGWPMARHLCPGLSHSEVCLAARDAITEAVVAGAAVSPSRYLPKAALFTVNGLEDAIQARRKLAGLPPAFHLDDDDDLYGETENLEGVTQ